jgi:hypothetical protein
MIDITDFALQDAFINIKTKCFLVSLIGFIILLVTVYRAVIDITIGEFQNKE